jgi:hypothetical protein
MTYTFSSARLFRLCIGQSKNCTKKALERILRVRQELDKKARELTTLEECQISLLEVDPLYPTLEELDISVRDLKAHRDWLLTSLGKQNQALGISEQQSLKRLMNSEYLCLQVNM